MMNKILSASLLALTVGASGCAMIGTSNASYTNATGEAWYVQTTGFAYLQYDPKVFYCPPPTTGPATCKQAKMVPLTKAEMDAEKAAK